MRRFFRFLFTSMLFASFLSWLYFGYVRASRREAILVEDKYKGLALKEVIRPSEFTFISARIFPGRITLHRIRVFPRSIKIAIHRGLSQSEMLGLDDTFYIRAGVQLDYELKVDKLFYLFNRLKQPNWKYLNEYVAQRLQSFFQIEISKLYKGDAEIVGLKERLQDFFANASTLEKLNENFKAEGIYLHSLRAFHVFVPDLPRYRSILSAGETITRQKLNRLRIIDNAQANRDAANIRNTAYYSRLEKIGQLLKKYPHLRDYLAVDQLGKNVEVMVMPYQHWFPPHLQDQTKKGRKKSKKPQGRVICKKRFIRHAANNRQQEQSIRRPHPSLGLLPIKVIII